MPVMETGTENKTNKVALTAPPAGRPRRYPGTRVQRISVVWVFRGPGPKQLGRSLSAASEALSATLGCTFEVSTKPVHHDHDSDERYRE
eukprot:3108139-Rhodomonas_salina.2